MTDRQLAARILLTGLILILAACPLLSGCAVEVPKDPVPSVLGEPVPTPYQCEQIIRRGGTC